MTNSKIGLNLDDLVLANGVKGEVIGVGANEALIKLEILIDGNKRMVQQWYKNDALKKIEVDTGVTEINTDVEVIVDAPTIEMGVPGGSQEIKKGKKNRRNK